MNYFPLNAVVSIVSDHEVRLQGESNSISNVGEVKFDVLMAFQFSNLLGSVYRKGALIFTPDGNSVISPVGNRITIFDLKKWVLLRELSGCCS